MTIFWLKRPSQLCILIALVVISVCTLYLTSCDNFSGPARGIEKKDTTTIIPAGPCDTASVSYSKTIQPLLDKNCISCHSDAGGNINGVNLSAYNTVRRNTIGNRIVFAVQGSDGITQMPFGSRLNECEIAQIRSWVRQGALNN